MTGYISVAAVTAAYGSALTAGHFWKDPKVTKRSSPHHSAPRLGSVCPHSGFGAWAAAMGHPWPSAANPASCRVTHAPKPAFGQRGLTGRLRSRSKADQKQIKSWSGVHRPVGAGLPAMQTTRYIRHTQLMPSQASQLPQGNASVPVTRSAVRPPRFAFDFDLRRPVKHAGRNSAWIWGVNRQGCRFSRPAPWMARGGGPQNPCRITGIPSLGEVPSVGARALWLLWGFSKVTRRKGETISSRYPNNGYVHIQPGPTP